MEELDQTLLAPDEDAVIPRIALSEKGVTGLNVVSGRIIEEANRAFQFPQFIKIVEEMKNNAIVAAALHGNKMMMGRVEWSVLAPVGASEQQKERAKFVESCMTDMEHSWGDFISDVVSFMEYGFSVQEIVLRRRFKKTGSKYNDGLVGIRKLPSRAQNSIYKWKFSEDGDRTLLGLYQNVTGTSNYSSYASVSSDGTSLFIPREKFLLFRCDATKNNPEGRSLLKGAYTSYRRLELLQDQLMIGVARDLGGIPVFGIHPKYMSPDASEAEKAVYQSFISMGENLTTGAQASVVLPLMYDPETKLPVYSLELLESKGGKAYDTAAIAKQFQEDILHALHWSVLRLAGNSGDSYSLYEGRTNLTALHLSYRLNEIAEVLNNYLIPLLFQMNGWEDTDFPKFVYSDLDNVPLEELSKYIQRCKAVGALEIDREVLNIVRTSMGATPYPDDVEPNWEALGTPTSRSGDSLNTPTGGMNGTADDVSEEDNSVNNMDNAA